MALACQVKLAEWLAHLLANQKIKGSNPGLGWCCWVFTEKSRLKIIPIKHVFTIEFKDFSDRC